MVTGTPDGGVTRIEYSLLGILKLISTKYEAPPV
jgi:hypothetical protein